MSIFTKNELSIMKEDASKTTRSMIAMEVSRGAYEWDTRVGQWMYVYSSFAHYCNGFPVYRFNKYETIIDRLRKAKIYNLHEIGCGYTPLQYIMFNTAGVIYTGIDDSSINHPEQLPIEMIDGCLANLFSTGFGVGAEYPTNETTAAMFGFEYNYLLTGEDCGYCEPAEDIIPEIVENYQLIIFQSENGKEIPVNNHELLDFYDVTKIDSGDLYLVRKGVTLDLCF
nr:MAG TPA: hypothetical protein [Caudoviricetes sp.]